MSTKILPVKMKDCLSYNPVTGKIIWTRSIASYLKGSEAGFICNHGYRRIGFQGTKYQAHRVAWFLYHGDCPIGLQIDHIDGNRQNNQINNLRLVNPCENACNSTLRKDNKSGHLGVNWYSPYSKWRVRIKTSTLGYFSDKQEAIRARKQAEKKLGFHPNHGKS